LKVLNGHFNTTTTDIKFDGGKDTDLGQILGIPALSSLPLGNDQMILTTDGKTTSLTDHPLKIHSTSDIVNDATNGVQLTSKSNVEIHSDVSTTIDHSSNIVAPNITLTADGTGSALVLGLLANASGSVTVNNATLNATDGTTKGAVTLSAQGKV